MPASRNHSPLLTIGMPAYNGAAWIAAAIESLQAQTFRDFRLVICDNASTDATVEICRKIAAGDARIEIRENSRNVGVFRNYDRAFEGVTTKYFKWASCNDLCAPAFLERCIEALEENQDIVLAYPRTVLFEDDPESGIPYADDLHVADVRPSVRFLRVLGSLRLNNAFNGVIRTAALRQTHLNEVYEGSDIILLAELGFAGYIWRLPEYLFFRRVIPAATAARKDAGSRKDFFSAEGRDVLATPRLDRFKGSLRAAAKAPIPATERVNSLLQLARRGWWSRHDLGPEFLASIRQRFSSNAP